ncbi:MAG: DUF1223 domain-containing protein [Pseudomonadota bacterium]
MRRSPARRLLVLGLAALGLLAAPGGAPRAEEGRPAVLVELFTSQGCSACPPADALLAELSERDDIVALSLHVDYWDYLGWSDVYASPAFTKRQAAYARRNGARSVYTPQMVVDGVAQVVGSRRKEVLAAIEAAAEAPQAARIRLMRRDGRLEARLEPLAPEPPAGVLWFVTYRSPEPVKISSGENAGRRIHYRNVARSWMKLGRWDGREAERFTAPAPAEEVGVAVILQEGPAGPVLAAARLDP